MTTVYLVRHAEAEGNVYRRCHGQYDSLLTPRAYLQLPHVAKRFEKLGLSAVYASDLFRARTTAGAIAKACGLPLQTLPVLREINMGDWEDLTWAELPLQWPEAFAEWHDRPWSAVPPNGESILQAGERMLSGVRALAKKHEGEQIAVVTHGSAIRGALCLAHGLAPEQLAEIGWGDNTCVCKLEIEGGAVRVVYENDASHLPEELSTFASIGWTNAKGMPASAQIYFRAVNPDDAGDAAQLISFSREIYRCAYGTDVRFDADARLDRVRALQKASPRAVTFGVLPESGELAALVLLDVLADGEPDVGLVGGFCIEGKYRGHGLSQQILGQAISVYRSLGKHWLCAHVAEHNERAKGFYQKYGFERRGTFEDANGTHFRMFRRIAVDAAQP